MSQSIAVRETATAAPEPLGARLRPYTTGIVISGIWLSALLASLFSPDLVSGTEQEHLPLAAIVDWL